MYTFGLAKSLIELELCLSVEPMTANAQRIRDNAGLNGVSNRVVVIEAALSDRNGEAELVLREDFLSGAYTGNASIAISAAADRGFQAIKVPLRKFDDILLDLGKDELFSVCKVDIEGHEDFFFRGASKWLWGQRLVIFTEANNWYFIQRWPGLSDAFEQALADEYRALLIEADGKGIRAKLTTLRELDTLKRMSNCLLSPAEKTNACMEIIGNYNAGLLRYGHVCGFGHKRVF